jgi:protease I
MTALTIIPMTTKRKQPMPSINEARILILATDGYERSELRVPYDELRKRGAEVKIASPKAGSIKSWDKKDWGDTVDVDLLASEVSVDDFDALVLPGGQINPDLLRPDENAMRIVKDFLNSGKTVAAICHAPWLLVEADALRGRDATSYWSIKTDVKNAGANWKDEEVVTDEGIITSRSPDDLAAFVSKIAEEIEEGTHTRRAA